MPHNGTVRRRTLTLIGLLLLAALLWWVESGDSDTGHDSTGRDSPTSTSTAQVEADGLPAEVAETLVLIDKGGPFPYDRDGVVFENREGLLPDHPRGYWHEYTVPTPGSGDRGARRLVVGGAGEVYYTGDHYGSFRRIRDGSANTFPGGGG